MPDNTKTKLRALLTQARSELSADDAEMSALLAQLDRLQRALDDPGLDYAVIADSLRAFPPRLRPTRAAVPATDRATARELWVFMNNLLRARPPAQPLGGASSSSSSNH